MQRRFVKLLPVICVVLKVACFSTRAEAQPPSADSASAPTRPRVVCCGFEHDFSKGGMETGFAFGGAVGPKLFASSVHHGHILGSVHVGRIMTNTICPGTWHEGNVELLAEAFGGYQVDGGGATFASLTPFIRYNFTGSDSSWVPFIERGRGVRIRI